MENTSNNTDQAVNPATGGMGEQPNKFKKLLAGVNWKITSIVVAVVVVLGALVYFGKGLFVAAVVNGQPISRVSVVRELEKQSGSAYLEQLITNKLITQEAAKKNVVVSDADVTKEMDTYKSQVEASGGNFDAALASEGLTQAALKQEIKTELELVKLLGDKVAVGDDEVNKYIADNKVPLPAGKEDETKAQIKTSLQQQKVGTYAQDYITSLKSSAKIYKFVNY